MWHSNSLSAASLCFSPLSPRVTGRPGAAGDTARNDAAAHSAQRLRAPQRLDPTTSGHGTPGFAQPPKLHLSSEWNTSRLSSTEHLSSGPQVAGQHLGGNDDTQRAARSGKLAALLKRSPIVEASKATAEQLKAVSEFKMITETEATIRKVSGVGLGLATAFLYSTSGLAYTTLSAGIFGALSVYRSGAAYQ